MVSKSLIITCRAKRKDSKPCKGTPLSRGSGYCMAHDPSLKDIRLDAARRGGRNKAKAVRLRKLIPPRLIPLFDKLETALDEVHKGKLEPRVGSSMAALAGAMVRVLTSGELEERVRALEERRKPDGK